VPFRNHLTYKTQKWIAFAPLEYDLLISDISLYYCVFCIYRLHGSFFFQHCMPTSSWIVGYESTGTVANSDVVLVAWQ